MSKSSFEEQYPDCKLIPESKLNKLTWPLIWLSALVLVVGIPGFILYKISTLKVPVPGMVGVANIGKTAAAETESGKHAQAVKDFASYFELGGQDADMMALYAYSLSELGRKDEALTWSRKAFQAAPDSRAARLIHDSLEPRK